MGDVLDISREVFFVLDKPNYYAIIPANVRYDKDLSANAKLLYGEITSLCNDKGYCWATNQYFCSLYQLSERTIQNLLKQLQEKKYIDIDIRNNTKRLISIVNTPEKNCGVGVQIISYPHEKNCTHNNKINNKNEYERKNEVFYDYNWLE